MEKVRDMKKHVTVVAALHIGFGVLSLLGALIVLLTFNFIQSFAHDVEEAEIVFTLLKTIIPSILSFGALMSIIGGIGLFSYKQWARIIIIIISALNCLNIPIGTLKGVYSIWVLLQDETIKLFQPQQD